MSEISGREEGGQEDEFPGRDARRFRTALGEDHPNGIPWYWIGPHATYDRIT